MTTRKAAAIAFVLSLAAYLPTLAPTVTGEDSGELVSAAWTLGIPHPPGYPLWCMITRYFMFIPVGDPAYRSNLASAVLGAAAAALAVALLVRLGVRPALAAPASLLLAFSSTFWGQAVIAEVYTLLMLTLIGVLYCVVAWRETQDARWLLGGAFLSGLSLGAHDTIILIMPLLLIFSVLQRAGVTLVAKVFASTALGLTVYLYLPIRAAAKPAMNWGNPDNWERFWAHVTRAQYPPVLMQQRTFNDFLHQMAALASYLLAQWPLPITIVILALAISGVIALLKQDNKITILLLACFLVLSVGFATLLNFRLDQEALHVAEVFFVPSWFLVVVFAALGLQRIQHPAVPAAAWALPLIAAAFNFLPSSMHGNDVARRYGEDLLATLPQNAIIFTSADYEAFPLKYLQIVEGQRADVAVLDEQRDLLSACQLAQVATVSEEDAPQALLTYSKRPIYFTRRQPVQGFTFRTIGLLYRPWPMDKGEQEARALDEEAWRHYRLGTPQGPWLDDWSTASILANYDQARARSALSRGDRDRAHQAASQAAARLPRDPVAQNDVGALLAYGGDVEGAIEFYRRAVQLRPDYVEAGYNLITSLIQLQRWDDAQSAYAQSQQAGVSLPAQDRIESLLVAAQQARR